MTGSWKDLRDRHLTTPEAVAAYAQAEEDLETELSDWANRTATVQELTMARLAGGLSCREVARRMRVSDATVRRLEHEGSDPTISLVQLYAGAVGYTLQLDLKEADKK